MDERMKEYLNEWENGKWEKWMKEEMKKWMNQCIK